MRAIINTVIVVILLVGASAVHAATVLVFAASSLTEGLKEIAKEYSDKSGDKIEFNFAASSVLARQIQEGASADIFFSADDLQMDALERAKLTDKTTRRERLSNTLVIVAPADDPLSIISPQDLTSDKVKHLALGDPRAVPAGVYAKRYLVQAGLWEKVSHKIVPMPNVRAVLSVVEAGNAEAGIVYKTDANISKKVRVAYAIPVADGPPIHYPIALVKAGKEAKAAQGFLNYLNSEAAGKVFEKFGFIVDKTTP